MVYTVSSDFDLKQLNTSDYSENWAHSFGGLARDVVIVDNSKEVFACSNDDSIKRLTRDGVLDWTNLDPDENVVAVASDDAGDCYAAEAGVTSPNLYKITGSTGITDWTLSYTTGNSRPDSVCYSKFHDTIFTGSRDGNLKEVSKAGSLLNTYTIHDSAGNISINDCKADEEGYIYTSGADGDLIKTNGADGVNVWTVVDPFTAGSPRKIAVHLDFIVVTGFSTQEVKAFNRDTGALLWTLDLGQSVFGCGVSPNGQIWVGGEDGTIYKVDSDGNLIDSNSLRHTDRIWGIESEYGRLGAGHWVNQVVARENITSGSNGDFRSRDPKNLATTLWTKDFSPNHSVGPCTMDGFGQSYGSNRNTSNQSQAVKLNVLGIEEWSTSFGAIIVGVAVDNSYRNDCYHGTTAGFNVLKLNGDTGATIWTNTDATNRTENLDVSADGFLYASDWNGVVRKINTSTGVTARTDSFFTGTARMSTVETLPDGSYLVRDRADNVTYYVDNTGSEVWNRSDIVLFRSCVDREYVYVRDLANSKQLHKVEIATGTTVDTYTATADFITSIAVPDDSSILYINTYATGGAAPRTVDRINKNTMTFIDSATTTNQEFLSAARPGRYGGGFWQELEVITGIFNLLVGETALSNAYLGAGAVQKIYLGDTLVFQP